MPKIENQAIYNAAFERTKAMIMTPLGIHPNMRLKDYFTGQYLYRYSSQSVDDLGSHHGNLKIWRDLNADVENRWTGYAEGGPGGQVGLYTTLEQAGEGGTVFAELFHYLKHEKDSANNHVVVYEDFAGAVVPKGAAKPVPQIVRPHIAERMHYMFAYTLTKPISVLDLQIPISPADQGSFVNSVYLLCKDKYPEVFHDGMNSIGLYKHDTDASFCRGIGNACMEFVPCNGILVTSARDTASQSIILKGDVRKEFDFLAFSGRSSFFVDPATGKGHSCAETVEDQIYNDAHFNVEMHPIINGTRAVKTPTVASRFYNYFFPD
jgi:hypothetical protein